MKAVNVSEIMHSIREIHEIKKVTQKKPELQSEESKTKKMTDDLFYSYLEINDSRPGKISTVTNEVKVSSSENGGFNFDVIKKTSKHTGSRSQVMQGYDSSSDPDM